MAKTTDYIFNPHLKLTWGGTIGDPAVEQWTNGIRLADYGDGDLPDDETLQRGLNAGADDIALWFNGLEMQIGNAARLTWAKLVRINEYGLQDGNTIRHDWAGGIPGGAAQNPDWNQTYAVTFRTNRQRGRASKGRIYPPLVNLNPEGKTPYIAAAAATTLASATGKLLKDFSDKMNEEMSPYISPGGSNDSDFEPSIISPGSRTGATSSTGAPTVEERAPIKLVVVDRTPDTQHRRTRQVPRAEGSPYSVVLTLP